MPTVNDHGAFRSALELHQQAASELDRLRAEHVELLRSLERLEPSAPPPTTPEDRARQLLAGEVPIGPADHLGVAQSRELSVRERIAHLAPVVVALAGRVEIERERARREAVAADPVSTTVQKAWEAAVKAAETAVMTAQGQRQRLLDGGYGSHDVVAPQRLRELLQFF